MGKEHGKLVKVITASFIQTREEARNITSYEKLIYFLFVADENYSGKRAVIIAKLVSFIIRK